MLNLIFQITAYDIHFKFGKKVIDKLERLDNELSVW